MSRLKQPKQRGKGHVASPEPVVNFDNDYPVFSFSYLQKNYGIKDCSPQDKARLADKLADLSCLTWKELKCLDRHKGGFEQIKELQQNLPGKFKEAIPIAFRFSGMAP